MYVDLLHRQGWYSIGSQSVHLLDVLCSCAHSSQNSVLLHCKSAISRKMEGSESNSCMVCDDCCRRRQGWGGGRSWRTSFWTRQSSPLIKEFLAVIAESQVPLWCQRTWHTWIRLFDDFISLLWGGCGKLSGGGRETVVKRKTSFYFIKQFLLE